MEAGEPRVAALRRGAITGALVVFALVVGIALIAGLDPVYAVLVGIGVGFFVGGALGFMLAGGVDRKGP